MGVVWLGFLPVRASLHGGVGTTVVGWLAWHRGGGWCGMAGVTRPAPLVVLVWRLVRCRCALRDARCAMRDARCAKHDARCTLACMVVAGVAWLVWHSWRRWWCWCGGWCGVWCGWVAQVREARCAMCDARSALCNARSALAWCDQRGAFCLCGVGQGARVV